MKIKCPKCKEDMQERWVSEVTWGPLEIDSGEDWFILLRDNIKKEFYECFECGIIKNEN